MAVTLNPGDRQVKAGTFDAVENLSNSTATTKQNVSLAHAISTIAGGTATGFGVNRFIVHATGTGTATGALGGPAVEGLRKTIFMLATGEAKVQFDSMSALRVHGIPEMGTGTATQVGIYSAASATGCFVLTAAGQYIEGVFINQKWNIVSGIATYATATMAA